MSGIVDGDRDKARSIVKDHTQPYYDTGALDCDPDGLVDAIAAALAAEREKARAPFLRIADIARTREGWTGQSVAEAIEAAAEDGQ